MNDLIIGACDKYDISQLKNWAKSINQCGFTGKKVIILYRYTSQLLTFLKDNNFEIINASLDYFAKPIQYEAQNRDTQAHQMRFYHIWQYLKECGEEFRYVITTDTRDVIFQKNPSEWLENNLLNYEMISPSESIYYKDESWNEENMTNGFGPYIWEYYTKNLLVCNVGTIAGKAKFIMDFALINYLITIGHYIPSDQSAFNLLVNSNLIKDKIKFVNTSSAWACQCEILLNRSHITDNNKVLNQKPTIDENGYFFNENNEKFYLVHQYDRIKNINKIINERYK